MRIVFISDTHNYLRQMTLPPGDMIVHAGDATMEGKINEVAHFAKTYGELPYKHRILIAGNHDWMAQKDPNTWRMLMKERGIVYLEDSGVELDGIKLWGSPWQPEFYDWAFNLPRGDALKEKWDLIPEGLDILVTHGPPRGKLDMTYSYNGMPREEVGCWDLARAVQRAKPKVHAFGHIHVGYGVVEEDGTIFVNPSSCNDQYDAVQDPIVLETNNGKFEVVHVGKRSAVDQAPRWAW